jgi:hypothetical protein
MPNSKLIIHDSYCSRFSPNRMTQQEALESPYSSPQAQVRSWIAHVNVPGSRGSERSKDALPRNGLKDAFCGGFASCDRDGKIEWPFNLME